MLQTKTNEDEYKYLVSKKAIAQKSNVIISLKFQKAINDLKLANGLLHISLNKSEAFGNSTFFDWVIISSYYSIFHSAQALLGTKKVKIQKRLHHATLVAFAHHFITNKELEDELFLIYEDAEKRAAELLDIIKEEKSKRAQFQYHRLSRYNVEPAKESIANATKFLDAIRIVLSKNNLI